MAGSWLSHGGLKLSFGTTDKNFVTKYAELNDWSFDPPSDGCIHTLIFPPAGGKFTIAVKLDGFDWQTANWLAIFVSEYKSKTPLVFFVPKRLMDTTNAYTSTSVFWRYAEPTNGTDGKAHAFSLRYNVFPGVR